MKQHLLIAETQNKIENEMKAEYWLSSISNHQLLYLYHCLQKFYFRAMRPSYISFLKKEDNCITPYTHHLANRCNNPFLNFKNEIERRQLKDNDPISSSYLWFEEKLCLEISNKK